MIRIVFGLYDKVAGEYRSPIFAASSNVVIRDLGDELRRADALNVVRQHPADFCLHEFGKWDSESGLFSELQSSPRLIVELDAIVDAPIDLPPGHDHQVGMP